MFKKIKTFFIKKKKADFLSRKNIIFLCVLLLSAFFLAPNNHLKWLGLSLCMFSSMANDSVQTLGTFLSSNSKVAWWKMWFYISTLFVITVVSTWLMTTRLDFLRLTSIPFDPNNNIFYFLSPILLIVLTYHGIPVSSTFLILSVFASQEALAAMLIKTFFGYFIGLIVNFILWEIIAKYFRKQIFSPGNKVVWQFIQWFSSGLLWVSWIINNTSNIVVYVEREFSFYNLCLFLFLGVAIIAFTIYNKGGPIQEIVDEKDGMKSFKITSVTNFCYAFILIKIAEISPVPIATTWVFIGILAGQEMGMAQINLNKKLTLREKYIFANKFIMKDLILAGSGVLISLIFALIKNVYTI
jgi:hypothetical protein